MAASAQAGVSVPVFQPDEIRHRRNISVWAGWINQGHMQNTRDITLNANATTTVILDERAAVNSFVGFMPLTANALSAQPAVRVLSQSAGGFTITHTNSASVDQNFRYCLLG